MFRNVIRAIGVFELPIFEFLVGHKLILQQWLQKQYNNHANHDKIFKNTAHTSLVIGQI